MDNFRDFNFVMKGKTLINRTAQYLLIPKADVTKREDCKILKFINDFSVEKGSFRWCNRAFKSEITKLDYK